MATKSATVLVRIEPDIKTKAENVLKDLGISPSTAVNILYRQVIKRDGLPFEIGTRRPNIPVLEDLSEKELAALIDQAEEDVKQGRTRPADEVFAELERGYSLSV